MERDDHSLRLSSRDGMNQENQATKQCVDTRRSQRVLLRVPVVAGGTLSSEDRWREETYTSVVNLNGGVIILATRVQRGQVLVLQNAVTSRVQECRVMSLGPIHDGRSEVGVEFTSPAPNFWGVVFPPVD